MRGCAALTYMSLTVPGSITRTDKEKWRETDGAGKIVDRSTIYAATDVEIY